MAAGPQIIVEYVAKVDKLNKANSEVGLGATKAGKLARKAFLPAVGALVAVGAAALKAGDAASALNEQMAASEQVFGSQAKSVQDWSKTTARSIGLSSRASLTAANAYGNMFNTVGLGAKDVARMSKQMVQLGGDMASFHDQDPTEMLDKLRSGLSGEAEPLRRFGVLISDARVKAFAYKSGIAKVGSELTEAQKVQARYGVIMEDTVKAQGDAARTSESVANKQRQAAAAYEDTQAKLGQALLPVMQAFLGVLQKVLGFISRYPGLLQVLAVAVVAVAAAVVLMNVALAVASVVASPVALVVLAVVAAIAALVVVIILVIRYWDQIVAAFKAGADLIKRAVVAVFDWIRGNWPLLLGILAGPFGLAVALIVRYWDQVKGAAATALGAIRSALGTFAGWIAGIARQIIAPLGWIDDALMGIAHAAQSMFGLVKTAINGLVSFLTGIVGQVRSAASSIAGAIKAPINAVLGAIDAVKISVKFAGKKLPGPIPDIPGFSFTIDPFPDVPRLAKGGVLSSPTLALVGEGRGREIITPEDLLRDIVGDGAPEVRVYIGDQELRGMIRYEVRRGDDRTAQVLLGGRA